MISLDNHFFITTKKQGDLFGQPFWMPSTEDDDHLDWLFPWTIPFHQNYSCIKNFILIVLDDLILAQRINRWTLLLLHEEFIVEQYYSCMKSLLLWFDSYMKNFIIIILDNLILAQRIYRWTILLLHEEYIVEHFYSCMKNLSLNDFTLAWRVYR